jgi:preprotein translocase subunit SecG
MTKLIDGGLLFLKLTVLALELVVLLQTSCGTGKGALWRSANRAIPKNKHIPLLHK